LTLYRPASFGYFEREAGFVRRFQQTRAELPVNGDGSAYNLARDASHGVLHSAGAYKDRHVCGSIEKARKSGVEVGCGKKLPR
jgi:hypothetical protein